MGTFRHPVRLASLDGSKIRDVEAIVDTGAFYTTDPASLCEDLAMSREGSRSFQLADGSRLEMDYGQAQATINGESVTTIVVFGADDSLCLLGAYTLEGLGLIVDPVNQRLIPGTLLMC